MSRFQNLRRTLQALVFATLPASAAVTTTGCCAGYEDPTESQRLVIDPASVAYGDLVKQCRQDDLSCVSLCEAILADQEVAAPGEVYFTECRLIEDQATEVSMTYVWPEGCVAGRRPDGLEDCGHRAEASAVGAWLAQMAYLEAAAIPAFVRTANELDRLGASRELVERALVAAADEIRHTEIMAALARAHGVRPRAPRIEPPREHTPLEFCLENAVEGCVRETFGAVVATWQGRMARDECIRSVMAEIAYDESVHAELSADIHAWAMSRLDASERALVHEHMLRAVTELKTICASESVAPELVHTLGVPTPTEALTLVGVVAHLVAIPGTRGHGQVGS